MMVAYLKRNIRSNTIGVEYELFMLTISPNMVLIFINIQQDNH